MSDEIAAISSLYRVFGEAYQVVCTEEFTPEELLEYERHNMTVLMDNTWNE
jgi:hypothetical protein